MKPFLLTRNSILFHTSSRSFRFEMFVQSQSMSNSKIKLKVGTDFYLAFSPEREDPNNPNFSTATIPKVVGGVTKNCQKAAKSLYDQVIVKTVPVC